MFITFNKIKLQGYFIIPSIYIKRKYKQYLEIEIILFKYCYIYCITLGG
jgi:hypothetical protein